MYVDENHLIADLKRDSQSAPREIYQLYAERLYAFCMQYMRSRQKSEELVEDTFVWLWTNRHHIRQEETLRSLLFIRVRHFVINAYRATLNAPVFEQYCRYSKELQVDDTSQAVEYDDFVRRLGRAMDCLPATQRKVVELSKLEQKSNREIARLLGLQEQTVKNQLSLGLRSLRMLLGVSCLVLAVLFLVK